MSLPPARPRSAPRRLAAAPKGVVLADDDPRAWRNTLPFPDTVDAGGPTAEQARDGVAKVKAEGWWRRSHVPVLNGHDEGKEVVRWDSAESPSPYAEEVQEGERARAEAYTER